MNNPPICWKCDKVGHFCYDEKFHRNEKGTDQEIKDRYRSAFFKRHAANPSTSSQSRRKHSRTRSRSPNRHSNVRTRYTGEQRNSSHTRRDAKISNNDADESSTSRHIGAQIKRKRSSTRSSPLDSKEKVQIQNNYAEELTTSSELQRKRSISPKNFKEKQSKMSGQRYEMVEIRMEGGNLYTTIDINRMKFPAFIDTTTKTSFMNEHLAKLVSGRDITGPIIRTKSKIEKISKEFQIEWHLTKDNKENLRLGTRILEELADLGVKLVWRKQHN